MASRAFTETSASRVAEQRAGQRGRRGDEVDAVVLGDGHGPDPRASAQRAISMHVAYCSASVRGEKGARRRSKRRAEVAGMLSSPCRPRRRPPLRRLPWCASRTPLPRDGRRVPDHQAPLASPRPPCRCTLRWLRCRQHRSAQRGGPGPHSDRTTTWASSSRTSLRPGHGSARPGVTWGPVVRMESVPYHDAGGSDIELPTAMCYSTGDPDTRAGRGGARHRVGPQRSQQPAPHRDLDRRARIRERTPDRRGLPIAVVRAQQQEVPVTFAYHRDDDLGVRIELVDASMRAAMSALFQPDPQGS